MRSILRLHVNEKWWQGARLNRAETTKAQRSHPKAGQNESFDLTDQPEDTLELSGNTQKGIGQTDANPFLWESENEPYKGIYGASQTDKPNMTPQTSGSQDQSGSLTRRLVAARSQSEVRTILSEAYKNMGELLQAAMSGDSKEASKALAAIKRLNKLINRAGRKIADLNKEDDLRLSQRHAEKQQNELRVAGIKAELERRITERKIREKKYLQDANPQEEEAQNNIGVSPEALEAQLNALAMAIAQASGVSAVSSAESTGDTGAVASEAGGGEIGATGEETPVAE